MCLRVCNGFNCFMMGSSAGFLERNIEQRLPFCRVLQHVRCQNYTFRINVLVHLIRRQKNVGDFLGHLGDYQLIMKQPAFWSEKSGTACYSFARVVANPPSCLVLTTTVFWYLSVTLHRRGQCDPVSYAGDSSVHFPTMFTDHFSWLQDFTQQVSITHFDDRFSRQGWGIRRKNKFTSF
jgi:hypothetical protein